MSKNKMNLDNLSLSSSEKEVLNQFSDDLSKIGVSITECQINQFIRFYEMLVEKNKVMNLTGITEFDQVFEKHFLDSISLARCVDLSANLSIMDMGTGAGFPGIPLKIAFPNLKMTLSDSLQKRLTFLEEVITELGLEQIETVHGRAEDLAMKEEYRERYDLCVSRAVANLSTLSEYCLPFVKQGGSFISYKSEECDEEVEQAKSAIYLLGGKTREICKFSLGESGRSLIVIDKKSTTPRKYPRKAGTPSRNPL